MADYKFILLTTVPKFILKEDDFDFYEYTYDDYTQMVLYDCERNHVIFDEDTGHDSPWFHFENFIEGLHYAGKTVEVDYAYTELPEGVDYMGIAGIHEVIANKNYVVVEL
jgi:hypothetical protein